MSKFYALSLHDALPISTPPYEGVSEFKVQNTLYPAEYGLGFGVENFSLKSDRKSTRLNSSHLGISYAVFCLKKKNDIDYGLASGALPVESGGAGIVDFG